MAGEKVGDEFGSEARNLLVTIIESGRQLGPQDECHLLRFVVEYVGNGAEATDKTVHPGRGYGNLGWDGLWMMRKEDGLDNVITC